MVGLVKGPMMAQSDNFQITVRGRGGHGSMPQDAGDGMTYPHHHPAFNFDERALAPAAFLMSALALEFLA